MVDRLMVAVKLSGIALLSLLAAAANADMADPTRPPPGFSEQLGAVAQTPQEAPLVVSSLFLMGAKSYAEVDGQIVRPGDPLAGGKVAKIDANGVWISIPGGGKAKTSMRLLKWLPEVVKTPVKPGEAQKSPPAPRTEKK
jgi:hypothetical protein